MKGIAFFLLRAARTALYVLGVLLTVSIVYMGIVVFIVLRGFSGSGSLPADCAVVFGTAVYGNQFPGPGIVRRVGGAGEYYRQGLIADRIILSGGMGTGNILSEARVMKREALKQGIPEEKIVIEEASHSTLENLRFSQPLAKGCETVVGISDRYHLARIDLLARRLDWDNFSTVPTPGNPTQDFERRSTVREIIAYVYYALYLDAVIHLYTD